MSRLSRSRRLLYALFASVIALLEAAGAMASARQPYRGSFPHVKHERLFPVCEGCHAGVSSGVAAEVYPAPADCTRCHDGTRVTRVEWQRPPMRASNLSFSHTKHFDLTSSAGEAVACQSCHAVEDVATRMNVGGPRAPLCLECHPHSADTHLAPTAPCARCHVPLAQATALPLARVAAFPRPLWHEAPDFLSTHARDPARNASCAVCHARETCERCHANGARLALVVALSPDARVAALEKEEEPRYPVPRSHRGVEWRAGHGEAARREAQSCANCHTRPSCTGCHMAGTVGSVAASTIASLPALRRGSAPGVSPQLIARNVHGGNIAAEHGTLAAAGAMQCSQCHSVQVCSSCHAGKDSRAFHPANFVERHASDVFAGTSSCQSCHSTETFCRDCHTRSGIASQSGMNAAFHTGQPMWVLSHGQAARTGMESCASCHRQADCVRCHSAAGGWGVNPHGADFPANRLASRNAASCRWCHSATPGRGGG